MMRVRCIQERVTEKQRSALGSHASQVCAITNGKSYLVLGILFVHKSVLMGSGVFFIVTDDGGYPVPAPLALFEMVDPRPSSFWLFSKDSLHEASLLPMEFQDKFFFDRLTDGEREIVTVFEGVVLKLDQEFNVIYWRSKRTDG